MLGFIVADPGPHELDRFAEAFLESFAGVVAQAATRDRLAEEATRRRALEETDRLRTAPRSRASRTTCARR